VVVDEALLLLLLLLMLVTIHGTFAANLHTHEGIAGSLFRFLVTLYSCCSPAAGSVRIQCKAGQINPGTGKDAT